MYIYIYIYIPFVNLIAHTCLEVSVFMHYKINEYIS